MRFCRAVGCGSLFWVCRLCDRGQCYCSAACRQQARHKQRRAANGRYQKTERGRFSHRLRQRAYRLRRARVTDHGCPPITRSANGLTGGVRVGAPGCLLASFSASVASAKAGSWSHFLGGDIGGPGQHPASVQKNTFSDDR
jgi:hypothetical protein